MKRLEECESARHKLTLVMANDKFGIHPLSTEQRAIIRGMSVALQWVCGDGGYDNALQRLLIGEPLAEYPDTE